VDDDGTYAGNDVVAGDAGVRELGQVRYGAVDVPKMGVRGAAREM
jgi:hypothetical protein